MDSFRTPLENIMLSDLLHNSTKTIKMFNLYDLGYCLLNGAAMQD